MLKRLYNEARFTLSITTTGPLLVRSGFPTLIGPDMTPVLTYRNGDWQVYIPGSSLKGVIRSHVEKICRTLRPDPPVVCNPFLKLRDSTRITDGFPDYSDVFCGDKFERRGKRDSDVTTAVAYADSCPVCRLFGSTAFIGRASIGDAYLADNSRPRPTELRDGVGIDRLTGGASNRALFNLETVSSDVKFNAGIQVRNFETWQLGMLLTAAQDMADGLVRIGSGRSRGFGSVTAAVGEVTISYIGPNRQKPADEVWGLGKFLDLDAHNTAYGTFPDDVLAVPPPTEDVQRGIRRNTVYRGDALGKLTEAAAGAFVARIEDWMTPESMTFEGLGYQD